jgi:hypothetical protein
MQPKTAAMNALIQLFLETGGGYRTSHSLASAGASRKRQRATFEHDVRKSNGGGVIFADRCGSASRAQIEEPARKRLAGVPSHMDRFDLAIAAIAFTALCAGVSTCVTPAFAQGWTLGRCAMLCFSAWTKVCALFLYLYMIQVIDQRDGAFNPLYILLFVGAGGWLLSHELGEAGFASKFPGVGALTVGLITVASGALYFALSHFGVTDSLLR